MSEYRQDVIAEGPPNTPCREWLYVIVDKRIGVLAEHLPLMFGTLDLEKETPRAGICSR
jgi:hypothetical protein